MRRPPVETEFMRISRNSFARILTLEFQKEETEGEERGSTPTQNVSSVCQTGPRRYMER